MTWMCYHDDLKFQTSSFFFVAEQASLNPIRSQPALIKFCFRDYVKMSDPHTCIVQHVRLSAWIALLPC